MTLVAMHRTWRGRGASGGGGGGGGGAAWRSALTVYPYTAPTGIDSHGVGTVLATTWDLAGQTGTVHTCTTQAHVTTALGAANPGDKIVINANIAAPSGGWTLGNRGTGTIYIVSSYVNAGTFERRASVNDWSALTEAEWATEVSACRARKADTYRILDNDTGNQGQDPIFKMTAARSTRWVLAGLELRVNPSNTLTAFTNYGVIAIENTSATTYSNCAGDVWVDRCYLHAGPTQNFRRAIQACGVNIAVTNSCIAEVHERANGDCQGIAAWAGGPYKFINNTIEGVGENILFGGSSMVSGIHPVDAEIRANHLIAPLGMLTADAENAASAWNGIDYRQKTTFEVKFLKRMWFEGNVVQYSRGSFGFGLQLQSAAQTTGNEFALAENFAIRQNRIIGAIGGINMAGRGVDFTTTGPSNNFHILDLLMTKIGGASGDRRGIQLNSMGVVDAHGITIDDNNGALTFAAAVYLTGAAEGNLTIDGLIAPHGTYGVFMDGGLVGDGALDSYDGSYTITWTNNALHGGSPTASDFNGSCTTTLLANRAAVGFDNAASDDWDVTGANSTNKANSTLIRALTDALNIEGYA